MLLGTENLNMVDFTLCGWKLSIFPALASWDNPGGRSLVQILQDAGLKPE